MRLRLLALGAFVLLAAGASGATPSTPFVVYSSDYTPELRSPDVFVVGADGSGRRNLTSTSAVSEQSLAASPTGEEVAFVREEVTYVPAKSDWATERSLWVRALDGSSARRLWTTGALMRADQRIESPLWSPDGRYLAFTTDGGGDEYALRVVPAGGGPAVALPGQGPGAWLPDGSRLVFDRGHRTFGNGLYWARPDGTGVTALTHPDAQHQDTGPTAARDGRRIAFARLGTDNTMPLLVLDIQAGVERVLEKDHRGCADPQWAPVGEQIASLCFSHVGYQSSSWARVTDAGGSAAPVDLAGGQNPDELEWSPDGARLALSSGDDPLRGKTASTVSIVDPRGGVAAVQLTGRNFTWLPKGGWAWTSRNRIVVHDASGREREIAYRPSSPDRFYDLVAGRSGRLVFASDVGRNNTEISTWHDGASKTLTANTVDDSSPALAPDGSLIAFLRDAQPWVMRPDGTGARRVAATKARRVDWWPDAATLVLWRDASPRPLLLGLDGSRTLLPSRYARWSADGAVVADTRGGALWVWRGGAPARRVATEVRTFDVAPDGTAIAYEQARKLYVMPVAGGAPRLFARFAESPTWSGDGRWLAFQRHMKVLTEEYALTVARRDGSGLRSLGVGSGPVWSPDGRLVAWSADVRVKGGVGAGLKVGRADGSQPRSFAGPYGYAFVIVAWSPDSRSLALRDEYSSMGPEEEDENNPGRLYLLDLVRGRLTPLNDGYAHEDLGGYGPACTITGTEGADRLTGTPGRDVICALGGDDVVRGLGGGDVVYGGGGNDRIDGGAGRDVLFGGLGADRIAARDGARDSVNGGPGRDTAVRDAKDVEVAVP